MKKIDLSIIVLSWNTKELLRECLKSLASNREVIVVDNGSVDSSPQMVENDFPKVKLIKNKRNLGFARANNQGIKTAKGKYIMLLNSDTVVQPKAIENLTDYLGGKSPEKLAVSPLLLLPNGQPQIDYYMRFPNLWQIFLYHNPILRPLVMSNPFLGSLIAQKPKKEPFEVDMLPGAALMISKYAWEKVGLLDEDYKFLFEDVDWCWRAKQRKIRLSVVPESRIIHVGGASWKQKLKENSQDFYYQFFASMLLFARKNYGGIKAKIFKWAIILNFLLTLKPKLAWLFLKNNGRQAKFLE